MPTSHISRRGVAKSAAWAIPAITVAAAAPAIATSPPPPQMHAYFYLSYNATMTGTNMDGSDGYKFYSVPKGSSTAGPGFYVDNTTTSTTITNATVTIWVSAQGLTWSPTAGGAGGWSTPTANAAKGTKSYNGDTYYAYTTTYTGTITAQNGTTTLPAWAFKSNNNVDQTDYFYGEWSAVVNGKTQTLSGGPQQLNASF